MEGIKKHSGAPFRLFEGREVKGTPSTVVPVEKHCFVRRRSGVLNERFEALVSLAKEIAKSGIPEGSRKIKGKFIQSHLFSLLEEELETLSWSQLEEFEYEPLEPIGDYDENDLVVSNLSIAEDVEHP
ncbi:hypothetical protein ACOSQ4_002309 [Xanthoceras sorbifolium]